MSLNALICEGEKDGTRPIPLGSLGLPPNLARTRQKDLELPIPLTPTNAVKLESFWENLDFGGFSPGPIILGAAQRDSWAQGQGYRVHLNFQS